jgi:hypothetical protein
MAHLSYDICLHYFFSLSVHKFLLRVRMLVRMNLLEILRSYNTQLKLKHFK